MIEVEGQLGGSCYQRGKISRRWKDKPHKGTEQKRDYICPLPHKFGVMGHGGGECAGCEEKGEEAPSWQLGLKAQLFYFFLPFLAKYQKDTMQGGWVWSCISSFCDSGLCGAASHSYLKLTRSPQTCTAADTWFRRHVFWRISENFTLTIIENWYWKYRHPGIGG